MENLKIFLCPPTSKRLKPPSVYPSNASTPQGGRAAPSERKSGLEMGVEAGKTTQDAIGPAARRPTSCGFADGLIGPACNPLKAWVTSDKGQYVNQVKLRTPGILDTKKVQPGRPGSRI